jgi:hypothetical protein
VSCSRWSTVTAIEPCWATAEAYPTKPGQSRGVGRSSAGTGPPCTKMTTGHPTPSLIFTGR